MQCVPIIDMLAVYDPINWCKPRKILDIILDLTCLHVLFIITNQKCKNRSENGSSSLKFAFGCFWLHLVAFELHSVAFDCIGGWSKLHCVASVHLVAFVLHRENSEATIFIILNHNHFHIRSTMSLQHKWHSYKQSSTNYW